MVTQSRKERKGALQLEQHTEINLFPFLFPIERRKETDDTSSFSFQEKGAGGLSFQGFKKEKLSTLPVSETISSRRKC